MKTAIIYYSLLGSTKKYAEWLNEKIEADFKRMSDLKNNSLRKYDTLIIMSGTYAGQMPLTRYLKDNWNHLKGKKIIAIGIGAAPADDEKSIDSYNLIPEEIRKEIKYFKLPGRLFSVNKDNVKVENLKPIFKEF